MHQYKYLISIIAILYSFSALSQTSFMSYNIRYNTPDDNENWWENRKEDVVKLINYYQPEILGIQEGLYDQVTYLNKSLANYSYVGVGRDDGKEKGEYAAIFYDTNRYEVIEWKTYWLSETPDNVSVGWDAALERITTFACFRNKHMNDTVFVFNCHYDHRGKIAREKSTELILSIIQENGLFNRKLVVMGDFNSVPNSAPIQLLSLYLNCDISKSNIDLYGPPGTFNGFKTNNNPEYRLDYIFTKNLEIKSYRHIDDRRSNSLWPSDHLPIYVKTVCSKSKSKSKSQGEKEE